ncbi:uncharacterized protein LTR77_003322 [Saxophila tyrrhenica]|uniref:Phosphoglycerate mutase-like protein n=1 Tax=Saxophila tyrrhenica TaxID=1690608 RepID=A0AAV9PHX9_9PEZI|nr:hypothetical protein LTR77_003322 [Saxophila tyrrhenica]
MPPTIHIVRHAQGYHNVGKYGEGIHDPFLTEEGKGQAQELCSKFPHHDSIDLLAASPMCRTIQTCQIAFQPAVDRGLKILLIPHAQEASNEQMDTGSTQEVISEAFGDLVDMKQLDVHPYWNRNIGVFDVNAEALIERARLLRRILRERPEKNIALVSHGSFAHYIVGNVDESGAQITRMWSNTECRSYQFVAEDDEVAELVETQESKDRRPDIEKQTDGYLLGNGAPRKNSAGAALSP